MDFIEQRLKSDPVARKILAMDEKTTRELDDYLFSPFQLCADILDHLRGVGAYG